MTPDIVKILNDYVSTLTQTVTFKSVVDNGDGTFTIETCDTANLRVAKCVEIGGAVYTITELIQDESFVVSGSNPITATQMNIDAPFFIHGTPKNASNEFTKVDEDIKYPFVYLYEIYAEEVKTDRTNPTAYSANLRLFFLDETNPEDYLTQDQYSEVIRPVRSLVELFLDPITSGESVQFVEQTSDFTMIPWVNFGKFQDARGNEKYIFKDKISGYELKINLDVARGYINSINCSKGC